MLKLVTFQEFKVTINMENQWIHHIKGEKLDDILNNFWKKFFNEI